MALGVSRDSIRRSRASARPARPLADLVAHACALAPAVRQAHASGRARAKAALAAYAETAATSAPSAASSQKWLAVTITTKVTTSGYIPQSIFTTRRLTRKIAGMAIISANATCMLGTAANGL